MASQFAVPDSSGRSGRRPGTISSLAGVSRTRPHKKELTGEQAKINLSASVDETDLIESGRGTGPTTPRQPVEARLQCPGANSSPNRNWGSGKMRRACAPSSRHDEKGFFIAPANGRAAVLRALQEKIGTRSSTSRRTDQLWKKTLVS